jgi:hypothetical protein
MTSKPAFEARTEATMALIEGLADGLNLWEAVQKYDARRWQLRPIDEWHEDFGPVMWVQVPTEEAPWCGTPLDSDWPGYHQWWCALPEQFFLSMDRLASDA